MTTSTKTTPRSGFDRFHFARPLASGVRAAGFEDPRPIQAETIPAGLDGRDVLGLAQTGTGKTAAFALPVLQRLLTQRAKGVRALILAPTRELATQIAAEIRTLAKYTKIKVGTVYGGVPTRKQVRDLRQQKPEIVVGCPGRVLDLLGQEVLPVENLETLVLDEADHMFDMGFLPDIRRILAKLPEQRQNLLFSATMPRELRKLVDDLLDDPHVVELANAAPAEMIDHALYLVHESKKRDLLEHVLRNDECGSVIVFIRTKHRARRLADQLRRAGFRASDLQGNMSQAQRDRAMRGFRARRFDVLVATDIAARGIDVSGISHVINYDVPNTPEAYTHRIGRTGRAEREGVARTFVTMDDRGWLRATERQIGSKIPRQQVDGFEHEPDVADQPPKRGPGGPKRPRRRFGKGNRNGQGAPGGTGGPKGRPRRRSKSRAS